MTPVVQALLDRFLAKVEPEPMSGCWLWIGSRTKGYGWFWRGHTTGPAHRWAYEHFIEILPASLQLDHTCRNTACVNPDHLEPVTPRQNVLRGNAPAAQQHRRASCIHGHVLDWTNTYLKPNGGRQCKPCRRETDRRRPRRMTSGATA